MSQAQEAADTWECTRSAFTRADAAVEQWLAAVQGRPVERKALAYYRAYWRRQNRKAGIAIS